MRIIALLAVIGAAIPNLAAASDFKVTVQPVAHFRALAPAATLTDSGLFVEGGYCREARYAARPQSVRIVKIDSAGTETASETVRILGATGNRSRSCGYYSARPSWTLSDGDRIEIRPNAG